MIAARRLARATLRAPKPMIAKPIRPSAQADPWCTKCRMDLLHRVIAMNGDKIVRVECLTCRGHHNYRKPKSAPGEAKARKEGKEGKGASKAPATSRPKSLSPRKATAAEVERQR